MVMATLAVFDIYRSYPHKFPYALLRTGWPYLPSLILFGTWMVIHYAGTGWVMMHPASHGPAVMKRST